MGPRLKTAVGRKKFNEGGKDFPRKFKKEIYVIAQSSIPASHVFYAGITNHAGNTMDASSNPNCSFCDVTADNVDLMVSHYEGFYICDRCIGTFQERVHEAAYDSLNERRSFCKQEPSFFDGTFGCKDTYICNHCVDISGQVISPENVAAWKEREAYMAVRRAAQADESL